MNCPWCGNEMQAGFVQSSGMVIMWTERIRSFFALPFRKNDVQLNNMDCICATTRGSICRECERVVIDYANEKEVLR